MSLSRTFAISERLARQVIKDHRSLALILIAPIIVMSLVGFSLSAQEEILNRIVPGLLGIFVLFFTFLLTGVSFLRERGQGTLERLQTTSVSRMDILVGYLIGFVFFAAIQSVIIVTYTVLVLPVTYQGEIWQIFSVLILLTVVSVSLGILISTFANNEFQVVQFIPIIIVPQIFLSGVIVPISQMPIFLEKVSNILPLRYAVEILIGIMIKGRTIADFGLELLVLLAFGLVFLALAGWTVKR